MRYAICALVLTLSACVTSRPIMLSNGTQALAINCPGAARDFAECMSKAAEACGGAYQRVDRDGSALGSAIPPSNNVFYMGAVHHTLIIKCGEQVEGSGLASLPLTATSGGDAAHGPL
jgi:hypothetical protein